MKPQGEAMNANGVLIEVVGVMLVLTLVVAQADDYVSPVTSPASFPPYPTPTLPPSPFSDLSPIPVAAQAMDHIRCDWDRCAEECDVQCFTKRQLHGLDEYLICFWDCMEQCLLRGPVPAKVRSLIFDCPKSNIRKTFASRAQKTRLVKRLLPNDRF